MNSPKSHKTDRGLLEKIINRIDEEQMVRIKRHLVTISFGLACAVVVLIPIFRMMQRDIAESGSVELLSLLFSDFRIMLADWRSFGIAVLESLPAVSIAIFLGAVLLIMKLMGVIADQASRISKRKSAISY